MPLITLVFSRTTYQRSPLIDPRHRDLTFDNNEDIVNAIESSGTNDADSVQLINYRA